MTTPDLARRRMPEVVDIAFLLLVGFAAGLAANIAGPASLFSYPALLSRGLSPVVAKVTNTVAVVGSGVGSALGSGPELRGQCSRVWRRCVLAVAGGSSAPPCSRHPAGTFALMVPWLIGFASLMIPIQPRPLFLRALHDRRDSWGPAAGTSWSACTAATSAPRQG